jgi:N,N'-diacetyllegionaminate synthase
MKVKKKSIFIIAEMANSHNGEFEMAKKIVDGASFAKADAIKFQKFYAEELAKKNHKNYKLYTKLEMPLEKWRELVKYAKSKNLQVYVDIFGEKSLQEMCKIGVNGFKIHSADVSNPNLLEKVASSGKPILLSTAGCFTNEIEEAVKILSKKNAKITLLHGFQGYPTKIEDLNFLRINEYTKRFQIPVGISEHVSGSSDVSTIISALAVPLGIKVIEKHIAFDIDNKPFDYFSALDFGNFKKMVKIIRIAEKSLGNEIIELSKEELKYRKIHKKALISRKNISKNEILSEKLFEFKRVNEGNVATIWEVKDKKLKKDIKKDTIVSKSLISSTIKKVSAVIACRVNSSRMYGKPLQILENYKIIDLLIEQIKKSQIISDIVLAISEKPENQIFIDYAIKNKLKFVIGDENDVLSRLIEGGKSTNSDIIFRATSDCPFIYWEGIDNLIQKHVSGKYDFSIYDKLPLGSFYEVINLESLIISHEKGKKKHRSELCSLYINEHKNKFKINRILPSKNLRRPELRLTVDSPEDLILARIIHKKFGGIIKPISLEKIINFLDKNPELKEINFKISTSKSKIWF